MKLILLSAATLVLCLQAIAEEPAGRPWTRNATPVQVAYTIKGTQAVLVEVPFRDTTRLAAEPPEFSIYCAGGKWKGSGMDAHMPVTWRLAATVGVGLVYVGGIPKEGKTSLHYWTAGDNLLVVDKASTREFLYAPDQIWITFDVAGPGNAGTVARFTPAGLDLTALERDCGKVFSKKKDKR
jgi:hypothetical protein